MIGLVPDTNIAVSAILTPEGNEARVFYAAAAGKVRICVSEPILAEYEDVLHRPKLRLSPERVREFLQLVRAGSLLVRPVETLAICSHEPDNRVLECADAAAADFLVTGNIRHFPSAWKTTRIVTARQLLDQDLW